MHTIEITEEELTLVRAALHSSLDDADPCDDPSRRRVVVVEAVRRECVQLEKGRLGVEQTVHTLPGEELSARAMLLDCLVASASSCRGRAFAELRDERLHALPVRGKIRDARVGSRLEDRH